MPSKTTFNKWKALGEKNLVDYLPTEKPSVAGVIRGFFYDVWLPLARREGIAHAIASGVTDGLYDTAVEYVRNCRPIGGARALVDDLWRCSMPATEDEFHSDENRESEARSLDLIAHDTTRVVLGTCGFINAFCARYGVGGAVVVGVFAHEVDKALGIRAAGKDTIFVSGACLAEMLGLPAAFAQIFDDHEVHAVLSAYGEPALSAKYAYKEGEAYADSPAKAAACAALVKQYNVCDYTLIKAVLDRLPWMN